MWVTLDRLCPGPNAAQLLADVRPNREAHNIGLLLWAFALSKVLVLGLMLLVIMCRQQQSAVMP